jgi:hypothetical protein
MNSRHIRLDDGRIRLGERLAVSFQRTLRIPDDGRAYPLPPGLGRFPIRCAADYVDQVPVAWGQDWFIPVYRREALWIGFEGASWKPNAVKVGVGGVDAVAGDQWGEELRDSPQNYLVVPDQPWLDGINSGDGAVRQFVAMPMGEGYSIEAQLTGEERVGGIQIVAFEPKPGRFPDEPRPGGESERDFMTTMAMPQRLGIAAGGTMRQMIYRDKYGLDVWDPDRRMSMVVRLVSTEEFSRITGETPPPTPVDAAAYTAAGFPWFELYDEEESDVAAPGTLTRIKSIRELERRGADTGIEIGDAQIRKLDRN